ncbi:MAG: histone H1 [Melioribacteraceae bacterium]|jgi:predicted  nucleic acid-binding Zn-ribbon protein|nr:histone H1 [Melioribacteraceae bacterium]
MSQSYQDLLSHLKEMEADIQKFYDKGQAAAGTRIRKGLSELKKKAQDMRNEVQDLKVERKG